MGTSSTEANKRKELFIDNNYIPVHLINEVSKSICKISYQIDGSTLNGTGFFMNASDDNTFRCLITNYHVINENLLNKYIQLEINNKKIVKLLLDNNKRYLKFFKDPLDITVIQIKDEDLDLLTNVDFLDYDLDYLNGYNQYVNADVFSMGYPYGKELVNGTGKVKKIINDYDFEHNIATNKGSSGSPIILINASKIIGVHKIGNLGKKMNEGTFIGEIINQIYKNNTNNFKKTKNFVQNIYVNYNNNNNNFITKEKENYIIAEIYIKDNDANQEIVIISSYEAYMRRFKNFDFKREFCNEEDIINCQIIIDNEEIPFSYIYRFKKEGKHTVKYKFKKYLKSMCYMFGCCSSLTNLDLSNFNTINVTNMKDMFNGCKSLTNLNLSNFNTINVTNMSNMFYGCKSLTNLNLSNFNTINVIDMNCMFCDCSSLINLNLSNFNTKNVTNMSCMVYNCKSLTNLNLSNFNTINVTNMSGMFFNCSSLTNLNLSNFNTINVTNMSGIFSYCSSLTNLNLSNFNTMNVTNMSKMFYNCNSLTNLNLSNFNTINVADMYCMFGGCKNLNIINVITKDKRLLDKFST